jgi:hypothetical protein
MVDSVMSQDALQSLITETEALGWDNPIQLEVYDRKSIAHEGFAFIGKLLSMKPQNTYHVRTTLTYVWSFAAPLSIKVLGPNKFLFTVPLESHFTNIMAQDL